MVCYDRDSVLEALRLSLPLDRTTDVGKTFTFATKGCRLEARLCVAPNFLLDPANDRFSLPDRLHELATSIMLEDRSTHFKEL